MFRLALDAHRIIANHPSFALGLVSGRALPVLALGATAIVLMAACGSAGASAGRSPSVTGSAIASPAVVWQAYVEPTWGYSINLPTAWQEVTQGEWRVVNPAHPEGSEVSRAFSNEPVSNAVSLAGADDKGIVFTVFIRGSLVGCQALVGQSTSPADASIDGVPSTVGTTDEVNGPRREAYAQAPFGKYCYQFAEVTVSSASRDAFVPIFKEMLASFKVGAATTPPF